jgi:hypothetical protein
VCRAYSLQLSYYSVKLATYLDAVPQVSLERERQHDQTHVQSQLEKLDLLEQEYNKLTAMQALAEVSQ